MPLVYHAPDKAYITNVFIWNFRTVNAILVTVAVSVGTTTETHTDNWIFENVCVRWSLKSWTFVSSGCCLYFIQFNFNYCRTSTFVHTLILFACMRTEIECKKAPRIYSYLLFLFRFVSFFLFVLLIFMCHISTHYICNILLLLLFAQLLLINKNWQ